MAPQTQQLTWRTSHAWLSLLAAMNIGSGGDGELAEFVEQCPLPVAVVELADARIVAMSTAMSSLLAVQEGDQNPDDALALAEDPDRVRVLMAMLVDGTIDAYEARRLVRRVDGTSVNVLHWVTVTDRDDRSAALWVAAPLGAGPDGEPVTAVPVPGDHHWPMAVPGLVMGIVDGSWIIERIGRGVEATLGHPSGDLLGQSLLTLVHPDDAAEMFAAVARGLWQGAGVGVEIRVRHRSGEWRPARAIIAPLEEDDLRMGFALAVARDGTNEEVARADGLARHLRRIAQEIEAVGVTAPAPITEPDQIPGLEDLSERQWQVLTRLMRGDRVPAIARDLYLSQSAVRNHLSALFAKVGVQSQEELLARVRAQPAGAVAPGPAAHA